MNMQSNPSPQNNSELQAVKPIWSMPKIQALDVDEATQGGFNTAPEVNTGTIS